MSDQPKCTCSQAPKLIFACAGASDTAEITFRAAKRLTKLGKGKMYCLAGIGGRVQEILDTTASADAIVAIDGCDADCTRLTLENAGITNYKHVRVTDLGLTKGSAPPNLKNTAIVVNAAAGLLANINLEEPGELK